MMKAVLISLISCMELLMTAASKQKSELHQQQTLPSERPILRAQSEGSCCSGWWWVLEYNLCHLILQGLHFLRHLLQQSNSLDLYGPYPNYLKFTKLSLTSFIALVYAQAFGLLLCALQSYLQNPKNSSKSERRMLTSRLKGIFQIHFLTLTSCK